MSPQNCYYDEVYKLRRTKGSDSFIPSDLKLVEHLRRLQYDQKIGKRTIFLVLGPSADPYKPQMSRSYSTYEVYDPCSLYESLLTIMIQTRDFCYDGYTISKSDWINNTDHIRISGIEPLSLIHSQQSAHCDAKNAIRSLSQNGWRDSAQT